MGRTSGRRALSAYFSLAAGGDGGRPNYLIGLMGCHSSFFGPLRGARFAAALVLGAFAGCATQGRESTVLQSSDLSAPPEVPFDRNNLMSDATFEDQSALPSERIQQFLRKTPYERASFLETYQSNGLRASDAVVRAAQRYRVNPLILLVRLQADQGLVGTGVYPQPPARVEYAFGCGCSAVSTCDPVYAGLDRQLDCLAQGMRRAFDQAATGATAAGWGAGRNSRTLDEIDITPANAATAALFDYTPLLGTGKAGIWLFWALFAKYAKHVGYFPPVERPPSAWVGESCRKGRECAFPAALCDTGQPDGACTMDCASAACPNQEGFPKSFCGGVRGGSFCLVACDPASPTDCRVGYQCLPVQGAGGASGTQNNACVAP